MRFRNRWSLAPLASVILAALLLGGCITVGGPAQPTSAQFYLLTAKASIEDTRTERSLGVGPVRIAPFLNRTGIVIHDNGGELILSETHRWAESLEHGIQRVLLQNMEALTGAKVRNFPWSRATAPDLALRLDVLDLNRRSDGVAVLEVNWVLEDLRAGKLIETRRDGFMVRPDGTLDDYPALVVAYSTLLTQLAERVAEYVPE